MSKFWQMTASTEKGVRPDTFSYTHLDVQVTKKFSKNISELILAEK